MDCSWGGPASWTGGSEGGRNGGVWGKSYPVYRGITDDDAGDGIEGR